MPRPQSARDLEAIFAACFRAEFATVLEGGGDEPLYLPSPDPRRAPHRVIYRDDYFASALHETAHWCIAGRARRRCEDYGYWYEPDGRSAEQQRAFERAEARPQALEWLFAEACGVAFHLSADNLAAGAEPGAGFAGAVARERDAYLRRGLPPRAERFRAALRTAGNGEAARSNGRPESAEGAAR